jgi:hypothetical protein
MNKRIAIHHYIGDFSDRWIEYCKEYNISYMIVDCYKNDIIEVMKDFDILLWPWNLSQHESLQFAKELIYSLEKMGKTVFPNFSTSYFYDNKVGQKYLLEAINAPVIPTNIFYNKNSAISWANKTIFPKVFKLSGGAGSMNVKLCRTKKQAISLINKAFGKGFAQVDRIDLFKDKIKRLKTNKSKENFMSLGKSFIRLFVPTKKEKDMSREKGYIYFQDFLPNNTFDIRIIIINKKAFAFKRMCRNGDFRASGSGNIVYDKTQIDIKCIEIAHQVSNKLNMQSVAFDFVYNQNNSPVIVEISYHFAPYLYDECQGYWTENLEWHDVKINPQYMIIEGLLK